MIVDIFNDKYCKTMLKNTLFVILLMISSLFTACAEGYVSDMQKENDTKEIRFSLNME